MEEKHKIPIPWCVDTSATEAQWKIIDNYRVSLNSNSNHAFLYSDYKRANFKFRGISTIGESNGFNNIEHFGKNTKLYTPQEAVDLIQGKQEVKELSQDDLLAYARKNYPVGTRYVPAHVEKGINEVIDTNYHGDSMCVYVKSKHIEESWNESLCHNGKWAEIISLPEVKDEIPVDKVESKEYEYEVVHCKTQEELEFVSKILNKHTWFHTYQNETAVAFKAIDDMFSGFTSVDNWESQKSLIISFEEWCKRFNHVFPVKSKELTSDDLIEGEYYYDYDLNDVFIYKSIDIKHNNWVNYKYLISIGNKLFYNNKKCKSLVENRRLATQKERDHLDQCIAAGKYVDYKEPTHRPKELLEGRYVKALRDINVLNKGEYDLITGEYDSIFKCKKSLSWTKARFTDGTFELMPIGFEPNKKLNKESELDIWLRETKAKNLSLDSLGQLIYNLSGSQTITIFNKLEGFDSNDKAQILYDLWNPKSNTSAEIVTLDFKDGYVNMYKSTDLLPKQDVKTIDTSINKINSISIELYKPSKTIKF